MRLPVVAELIVIVQLSRAFCGRMSGRLPHIIYIHVYRLVDDDLCFIILCLSRHRHLATPARCPRHRGQRTTVHYTVMTDSRVRTQRFLTCETMWVC